MTEATTTECPACGGVVSLAAAACPHCGHPMDRPAQREGDPAPAIDAEDQVWRMSHLYYAWRYVTALILPLLPLAWNLFLGGGGEAAAEGAAEAAEASSAGGLAIPSPAVWYVCLALLAVSLILLGSALFDRFGRRYTLTHDGYVRERHGILTRKTAELHVSDIRLVNLRQSLWQRLFGVGCIDISSAGHSGVEVQFIGVPDAERVKERILDRADTSDD